jgi:hypothetical protein
MWLYTDRKGMAVVLRDKGQIDRSQMGILSKMRKKTNATKELSGSGGERSERQKAKTKSN